MKHFIFSFAEQENKLKPKFGVRAINTKRPRQQLSSRAKISKVQKKRIQNEFQHDEYSIHFCNVAYQNVRIYLDALIRCLMDITIGTYRQYVDRN